MNISKIVKNSTEHNVLWSIGAFYDVLDLLSQKSNIESSFWDGEENWAILSINGKGGAYLWKKYPLIFVEKGYSLSLQKLLESHKYIEYIEVKKIDSKEIVIDAEIAVEFFGQNFKEKKVSAMDIWFYTNSL